MLRREKLGKFRTAEEPRRGQRGFSFSLRPDLLEALQSLSANSGKATTQEIGSKSNPGDDCLSTGHNGAPEEQGATRAVQLEDTLDTTREKVEVAATLHSPDDQAVLPNENPKESKRLDAAAEPLRAPESVATGERPPESRCRSASLTTDTAVGLKDMAEERQVSVRMRVLRKPKLKEKLGPISQRQAPALPAQDRALTPVVPQTWVKSRGCWYMNPEQSPDLRTPSTLAKAPGCWYFGGSGPSPLGDHSTPSAPSTLIKAKGCWYLQSGGSMASKGPQDIQEAAQALPIPLEETGTAGGSKLGGFPDISATPAPSLRSSPRTTRKRKSVTFSGACDALPAEASGSRLALGSIASPQNGPGVLTQLRCTYGCASAVRGSANSHSSDDSSCKWRVELGSGLSPISFTPIPIRFDHASEQDAMHTEDMEVDYEDGSVDDEDIGQCGEEESPCAAREGPSGGTPVNLTPQMQLPPRKCRSSIPNQRLREAAKRASTPGIIGAGTKTVGGLRRSTRQRYQPLEYWRNEHKEYSRNHSSMPTVVNVATRTPDSAWPMGKNHKTRTRRKR
uniref:Uncharacterized protein n=2 Tax=Tetraselmis sp. GSL018 TaxID=582737 RepID=A0A061QPW6_9CHLO